MKERIGIDDSGLDIAVKMAEGNPGALSVLTRTFNEAEKIDPDNAFGPFGPAMILDTFGIYGSDIWVLYKDVADQDLAKMIGILRAVQMGVTHQGELKLALVRGMTDERKTDLLDRVKKLLPNFNLQAA